MGIPFEMNTMLVIVGVAGLVICGAIRLWPKAKEWVPDSSPDELVDITRAYAVLHKALIENENVEYADKLRCEILPQALVAKK